MKYLIKKGYYINGVAQVNFDSELVDDCYTYLLSHITGNFLTKKGKKSLVKYNPEKGNIASFIHTWCRGYCNIIVEKQSREYKYSAHRILQLDDILLGSTPNNFITYDSNELIDDAIDKKIFLGISSSKSQNTYSFCDNLFKEFCNPLSNYNFLRRLMWEC